MYQVIRNTAPHVDGDWENTDDEFDLKSGDKFEVCWLPSVPLTKKYKVPPISGLGILYSEELDRVLHVFETDNLKDGINNRSRDQAAALNIDPGCRLHWMEITNPTRRAYSRLKLLTQIKTQYGV